MAEVLNEYALQAELSRSQTRLHVATRRVAGSAAHFAIKRLTPEFATDPNWRALLLDNGRALLGLRHPHLARVIEVYDEPEPFWVCEWIHGVTLSGLFELTPSPELTRCVLRALVDVLSGLEALHSPARHGGLVHGAPTARHIVVGDDGRARLIDFSHATGATLPWRSLQAGRILGCEMAPEQALAPTYVDGRCDLFIVGTLLFRALCGCDPFAAQANSETDLHALLRAPIERPSAVGSVWGHGLDRVCMRALQRSRADRFGSAAEMASALRGEARQVGGYAEAEEVRALVRAVAHGSAAAIAHTTFGHEGPNVSAAGPGRVHAPTRSANARVPPPSIPLGPPLPDMFAPAIHSADMPAGLEPSGSVPPTRPSARRWPFGMLSTTLGSVAAAAAVSVVMLARHSHSPRDTATPPDASAGALAAEPLPRRSAVEQERSAADPAGPLALPALRLEPRRAVGGAPAPATLAPAAPNPRRLRHAAANASAPASSPGAVPSMPAMAPRKAPILEPPDLPRNPY